MYESKYFKPSEFRCKGKECKDKPDPVMDEKLLILLDKIREKVGKPIVVNCGFRCPRHNKDVGGATNSTHMYCKAADLSAVGIGVNELAQIAEECGFDGIGRYPKGNFVHVDSRGYKARWNG